MSTAATPTPKSLAESRATFLAQQKAECLDILASADDVNLTDEAKSQLAAKLDEPWVVELVLSGRPGAVTPRRAWAEWCRVALVAGADYPFEVRRRRLAARASNVEVEES